MPTRRDLEIVEAVEVTSTLFEPHESLLPRSGGGKELPPVFKSSRYNQGGNPLSLMLENEVSRCRLAGVYEQKANLTAQLRYAQTPIIIVPT
jgi:hypothetical protein